MRIALTPPCGPVFVDLPLDYVFMEAVAEDPPAPLPQPWLGEAAATAAIDRARGAPARRPSGR